MQRVTLENETKVGLLYALKDFTTETVKDLLMPVKRQKQDEREPKRRAAAVFLARLPDMTSLEKKAPFILHQAVTGEDGLKNANKGTGRESRLELQSSAVIRSVFCVYHPDGRGRACSAEHHGGNAHRAPDVPDAEQGL